jgi:hypothetical protein
MPSRPVDYSARSRRPTRCDVSETWADLPSLLDTRDRLLTARIESLQVGRHSTRDQLRAAALEIAAALVLPPPEAAPDPIAEVSRQIKAMLGDVPLARHVEASESWRRLLRSLDTSIGPRGERLSLVDPLGHSWTTASFVGFVAGLAISAGAPFRAITRRGVLPSITERRVDEAVGLLRVGVRPQAAARATRISLATLYSQLHSRGLTTPGLARVDRLCGVGSAAGRVVSCVTSSR